MKRRNFLSAASAIVAPLMLDGFRVKSLAGNSALAQSLSQLSILNSDRVLVIIYLGGGNDGLNTVIPLEYYSEYYNLRSNIAIPENSVLRLSGNSQAGFHPSMSGMRALYDDGKLAIVNGVSYPNPDKSHYRSTEIWMTGVDSNQYASSGWAGRYLNSLYEGYPLGYPNSEMEDPLAVQIGQISTSTFLGKNQSMGVTIQDPNSFYQLIGDIGASIDPTLPCCDAGELLAYVRQKQTLSVGYASEIKAAADAGKNLAVYPDASQKNELADQLRIVARLIHGGLKSKIYYVELGGFDTHSGQVGLTNTEGTHAQLLRKLSEAITSFQNDLKLQGTEDNVLGMTFSDFGRRATSNASKGTDHGIGAPMFVFGTGIKRRLIGNNPDLVNGLLSNGSGSGFASQDIKMQIDFRRVYTDILKDWFTSSATTASNVLYEPFKTTSLFSDTIHSIKSGAWDDPEVWSHGRLPIASDKVNISSNTVVITQREVPVLKLNIETGGELKFIGKSN